MEAWQRLTCGPREWAHRNRYWLMACAAAAGVGLAFGLLLAIRAGRADSEVHV